MSIQEATRTIRILAGFVMGILAIYTDFAGKLMSEQTIQLVILSIFTLVLLDTPKEE